MDTATHGQIPELQRRLVGDLRQVMQKKGLTQGQMAQHCGISAGSMSDLIHEKSLFSGPLLGKLSRVLGDFMTTEGGLFTSVRQYQKMMHIAAATRELANSVARKLKRLHTLTESQLGVLIVAHPELKVKDKALIVAAQQRWRNYGAKPCDLCIAEVTGLSWSEMNVDEFNFLASS